VAKTVLYEYSLSGVTQQYFAALFVQVICIAARCSPTFNDMILEQMSTYYERFTTTAATVFL